MKTINEQKVLTIQQLEERFEMVVASKGSSEAESGLVIDLD